jgi:hypothetical protein
MREIDHMKHAEDDGHAQTQERVERSVYETNKQLAEKSWQRHAEESCHR